MYITTGEDEMAGVEANVTMAVYGSEGISKQLHLGQENQPIKMEPRQTQEFQVIAA